MSEARDPGSKQAVGVLEGALAAGRSNPVLLTDRGNSSTFPKYVVT